MFYPDGAFAPITTQNARQLSALQQMLLYVQQHSPFYKRKKIEPGNISSLEDLQRLPVTTKADIQLLNDEFLCVARSQVKEYVATSGTLGNPVTIALTENDLKRLAYNEHQSFLCAGGNTTDVYQLMLTLDRQFMAGIAYYTGIQSMGASLVRTGPGLPQMQWETILRLGTTALVAVPSFLLKMIDWAKNNGIDLHNTPVKKAICIGESLRHPDGTFNTLGEKIAKDWPIKLYGTYAATELQTAFTDCDAGQGGHVQTDLIIVEILDENDTPLPNGEPGEITITTLGIEGMPLLRYKTGDIGILFTDSCSCGRHSPRLSHVIGRKQQMVKYKGTTLYPPAIFDMLNAIAFVKEYVVEVRLNDLGTDDVLLYVLPTIDNNSCLEQIRPFLQAKLRVVPQVICCNEQEMFAMQFPPNSRKQIRFIDNR